MLRIQLFTVTRELSARQDHIHEHTMIVWLVSEMRSNSYSFLTLHQNILFEECSKHLNTGCLLVIHLLIILRASPMHRLQKIGDMFVIHRCFARGHITKT